LHTSARTDTFASGGGMAALRAGDLVYMTVPNDGQHVFVFDPILRNRNQGFGGSLTSVQWIPSFRSIDGSGATLTIATANATDALVTIDKLAMTYSPADDEDVWWAFDNSQFTGGTAWHDWAFNPARTDTNGSSSWFVFG